MDLGLQNKVIIVTGGAKGIGEGIAVVLAKEGAQVVIVGRNAADNEKTVQAILAAGGKAVGIQAELSLPAECEQAVKTVTDLFGRIDGLVNNAGVNDGVGLESGNYEKFMASLHKNLVHYYLMAQYALPWLKQSKGSIVNITSKTAETGQGNTSAYAAANGGRNAPVVVIHGNQTQHVPDAYRRFLENHFRETFRLKGTPMRVEFRTDDNPFKGRRNELTPRQVRSKKRLISRSRGGKQAGKR